jgi:beta-glucosidase
MKNPNFPKNFLWGASTSSHQVEGGNKNDWTRWETSKKRLEFLEKSGLIKKYGLENFISGKATDHYSLFENDFELAKELGHNATRFSIEWSRIEPEEGVFNQNEIEHYRKVIKKLRELKIEPFVTLWHFTNPLWFSEIGGWENKKSQYYFSRYAKKIGETLGEEINFWITLNEPEIYTLESFTLGLWPPNKKNIFSSINTIKNMIAAHKAAYNELKKINFKSNVGIAKNNIYFEAYGKNPFNKILKKIADHFWNYYFLNKIDSAQDFIGLNYYFHSRIKKFIFNQNENIKVSDIGWELYPEGIYHLLKELERYKKPIYITENGLADSADKNRGWYILEILKNVKKAIDEGVDVRGYFHWSLIDNFEWDKGFWPKFGLIEIDYKTFERKPRPSAEIYKKICKTNSILN